MSRRALLLLAFLQLLRMRKRRQGEKNDGNVLDALSCHKVFTPYSNGYVHTVYASIWQPPQ
jgi:hypothetical protein